MPQLPADEGSFWRQAYQGSSYPALQDDLEVDVGIVGGGITGLTAAYRLKQSGLKVAVLEKDTIGGGTSGRTTGKVSSLHNILYHDFQERLGKKTARLYGEANQAAVEQVAQIIKVENIKCDWQRDDNFTYTDDVDQIKQFKAEAATAASLGLPASFETTTPLPFKVRAAVKFSGQGKLHSQKYLIGLAAAVNGGGSHIFEKSNVIGIRDGNPARLKTGQGKVYAKDVIVATNVPTMPLLARGAFCILEYPTESYIVLGRLKAPMRGMYISPDKEHYSILPMEVDGEQLLLIGGESNVSGVRAGTRKRYQKLADYAAEKFDVDEITHYWSDRDYMTYDGPPLAGKLYPWSKHLYVASAFRKWGLSNGTAAAMIIHDQITGQANPWAAVYNPNRLRPVLNIPRVAAKYLTRQI